MDLVIGCTSRPYSALPFAEACDHIAKAGYSDVALLANQGKVAVRFDSTEAEVAEARKAAADAGLRPSMLIGGTRLKEGLKVAVDDYKKLIDNAAALGADWLLDCGTQDETLYDEYYELMRRVVRHAQEAGVQITLKPHGGIGLTPKDLVVAYHKVEHPCFGICYDPGNVIFYTKGAARPETDIREVAPLVTTGIIKDCVITDGKPDVMVNPGDGLVDFRKVLSGLTWGGFRGPLYVECVAGTELADIDANVKGALKFVQGLLEGI